MVNVGESTNTARRSYSCNSSPHLNAKHFPIAHMQNAVADRGGFLVVGDHEDRLFELAIGYSEHFEHGVGILGIEIAGWFVGKNNRGTIDEGAGDGDALLFAARELGWPMVKATLDSQQSGEVVEIGGVEGFAAAGDVVGDLNIVARGQGG